MIGATGTGKSTLLLSLALQDAVKGGGFAFFDPHGETVEALHALTNASGRQITYLDPTRPDCPYGYNPLRKVGDALIPLAASGLLDALRKLWSDAWGVRMEHILRCSLYTLLDRSGSTLLDVLRLYADQTFREDVTSRVRNPVIRAFWIHEFERYPERYRAEVVAPIQNKLGALLADPRLFRTLVNPTIDVSFRRAMDRGDIVLVNLSKGVLGQDGSNVLGSLLVATLGLAALSRADVADVERRPFVAYIDEFPSFSTLAFTNMMAELRKYGLALVLAHQHLHQLDPEVRHAVLGNAGTLLSFRVGAEDASFMAREFQPRFGVLDLLSLPNRHFYIRMLIEGSPAPPFSGVTLEAAPRPHSCI